MESIKYLVALLDGFVLAYLVTFFVINLGFLILSSIRIRRELKTEQLQPALASEQHPFLPMISLLVPAYNEEVTIVQSVRSLLKIRYPAFEIIICNDGSKDRTVDVLRHAFHFVRTEIEYNDHLGTSAIVAFYECRQELAQGLRRFVLIDKENGGKADALNAAANVAQGHYVTSMDADSLLVPDALLLAARPILDNPDKVIAVGGQVGLSNGSYIESGKVVTMGLAKSWIGKFQVVEYMRSFAQGRIALASTNSLLVLSGVFALMRRDLVIAIGGFLTKHMRSRVGIEYCGKAAHTVCEDMEIVVRLHRYVLDKGIHGHVVLLPFPIAWTEAPENYRDLGKQRSRWYRGLLEVLGYHRTMLFNHRFKQIGMFSLPYQLFFEALAPILEGLGYILVTITALVGLLSFKALFAFLALAMAINGCLSTLSILLCVYSASAAKNPVGALALFSYPRLTDIGILVLAALVSNFGYRQYLIFWQLKGLIDFLRRREGWDKFARQGFAPTAG